MTNSEAIEQLKERYDIGQKEYLNFVPQYIESLKLAMESLKENDKLKAENERLKSELEQWQSTNLELVCELTRIECENNQLKSELEQSIKLPCKIGDTVYCVDFYNNTIDESTVNDITYYAEKEEFSFDSGLLYFWSEDIGKCVFLTQEEAEQALKGKEKE